MPPGCRSRFATERAQLVDALGELALLGLVEWPSAAGVVGADGRLEPAAAL